MLPKYIYWMLFSIIATFCTNNVNGLYAEGVTIVQKSVDATHVNNLKNRLESSSTSQVQRTSNNEVVCSAMKVDDQIFVAKAEPILDLAKDLGNYNQWKVVDNGVSYDIVKIYRVVDSPHTNTLAGIQVRVAVGQCAEGVTIGQKSLDATYVNNLKNLLEISSTSQVKRTSNNEVVCSALKVDDQIFVAKAEPILDLAKDLGNYNQWKVVDSGVSYDIVKIYRVVDSPHTNTLAGIQVRVAVGQCAEGVTIGQKSLDATYVNNLKNLLEISSTSQVKRTSNNEVVCSALKVDDQIFVAKAEPILDLAKDLGNYNQWKVVDSGVSYDIVKIYRVVDSPHTNTLAGIQVRVAVGQCAEGVTIGQKSLDATYVNNLKNLLESSSTSQVKRTSNNEVVCSALKVDDQIFVAKAKPILDLAKDLGNYNQWKVVDSGVSYDIVKIYRVVDSPHTNTLAGIQVRVSRLDRHQRQ